METGDANYNFSEPPKPPEGRRKERLSDDEMGNLISAVGNHEAKAITLGMMESNVVYSAGDISRRLTQVQEGKGWNIDRTVMFGYLGKSLCPIGLVANEVINPDLSRFGYIKTDYGKQQGDALAGILLDFSLRHPEISLFDVFGSTQSRSKPQETSNIEFRKRAPITRLKLFWELITRDLPVRVVDIMNALDDPGSTVTAHLVDLSETGILSFESQPKGQPVVYYSLSDEQPLYDPKPYAGEKSKTDFALKLLRKHPDKEWTLEEVEKEYLNFSGENILDKSAASYRGRFSWILSNLVRDKYAKRGKFVPREKQSEINLNEGQKNMLFDLVYALDRFQDQDPEVVQFGLRRLKEIMADPDKISILTRKAREHSPYSNSTDIEELSSNISQFIRLNPGCTIHEVRNHLLHSGIRIQKQRVGQAIKGLVDSSNVIFKTLHGVRHFSVVDENQQVEETSNS